MDLAQPFLREGLLGAIIVSLGGVVGYLYREIKFKDKLIMELQDKRLLDSNQYTISFTSVAKEMVASNRDAVNAYFLMQKSIDSITQILQSIVINK